MSRQSTGTETAGGSWAGVSVGKHRVLDVEGAGAEAGEEEVEAPGSGMEQGGRVGAAGLLEQGSQREEASAGG